MGARLAGEVTVNPRFGRRSWVKLWVNEWLDGTTRYEMSDAQRAFWIDLLAMAGRSRYPGVICAGKSPDNKYIGYPINKYQSLMSEPLNVEETLAMFERTGKISVEITSESPLKLFKLELLNWDKYQSEYQRQKGYRKRGRLQESDSGGYNKGNKTEVEGETDTETEEAGAAAAFRAIGFNAAFGQKKFQSVYVKRFSRKLPGEWLTEVMESTLQECQQKKIGVPPQFYEAKRDVEVRENATVVQRAPL